jgi:hypothetical protein
VTVELLLADDDGILDFASGAIVDGSGGVDAGAVFIFSGARALGLE